MKRLRMLRHMENRNFLKLKKNMNKQKEMQAKNMNN